MDLATVFLDRSRHYLRTEYPTKLRAAVEALPDDAIWWRPNAQSNSVGNLILHIEGNVREWLIGGVGKLPFERERQQEFDERREIPRSLLIESLRRIVKQADDVLANLDATVLTERRQIQGRDVTVLRAVYHVVEHFSMHAG